MAPRKKSVKVPTATPVQPQVPTANQGMSELDFVRNALIARTEFMKSLLDPKRDLNDECGYPETNSITAAQYKEMYNREIGKRVVDLEPSESWKIHPCVYELEDEEVTTDFEVAWNETMDGLRGTNWYVGEEGNLMWEALQKFDELSGVGKFGVLLLGIDDGKALDQPVDGMPPDGAVTYGQSGTMTLNEAVRRKLLYVRSFDESLVTIATTESEVTNPRYGQPTMYNINFNDVNQLTSTSLRSVSVHWTRVIHLIDNVQSSEVYGTPRQQPVFNRLLDIRKLYGGSAEMYWKGAFPGLSLETQPGYTGTLDKVATKEQLENYQNSLQRYLALAGVTANSLAPQVVDPTAQIKVQIEAICIILGCPVRIFMGSERGELASSQDKDTWDERMEQRRNNHITPRIIVPVVNRLIQLRVLPEPQEGFKVDWDDSSNINPLTQATISKTKAEAMATYVNSGSSVLMSEVDFLTKVLDYGFEESQQIVDNVLGTDPPETP